MAYVESISRRGRGRRAAGLWRPLAGACLALVLSTPVSARLYQWTDPGTGTVYLSGTPPAWYRTRHAGPRVLVFEGRAQVDDTELRATRERAKALREQALKEADERRKAEARRRAEAERLAREQARKETASKKPEVTGEEDAVAIFRALIAEWDKRKPQPPLAGPASASPEVGPEAQAPPAVPASR